MNKNFSTHADGRIRRRDLLQGIGSAGIVMGLTGALQGAPQETKGLRVMSFNIWVDGKHGGTEATAEVIRKGKADIVGLQEVHETGDALGKLTGMRFIKQPKGGILTRFPVVAESPNRLGVQVETENVGKLWIYNTHLPAAPYQPYQLADIPYGEGNPFIRTSGEAIAEAVRSRSNDLARLLMDMSIPLREKSPIVVTGDFNEPSHLDWTEEVRAAGRIPIAVAWPQSRMMIDAGFEDSLRAVHKDPVKKPAHTWTPKPSEREIHDRIDFVYSIGLKPVLGEIVGESAENADIVLSPYPSDHRAVVIEFEPLR